jgi:hypothetical protein
MELIIGIVIGCAIAAFVLGHHVGALSGYIKRAKEFEVSALAAVNSSANPNATAPKAMALLQRLEGHLGRIAAAPSPAAAPPVVASAAVTADGALKA